MDVKDLIETIGKSVSDAQQGIEWHSINSFFEYFQKPDMTMNAVLDDNTEDVVQEYVPITKTVAMPCADDISKNVPVEIPLVALTHHRQVHLDKVTVKVKTRFTSDKNSGSVMADINAPVLNAADSFEDTEAVSSDDGGEIELVFNVADSAEGTSRVVQNISKII